jgi:mono/diheme cytochrome c family protein
MTRTVVTSIGAVVFVGLVGAVSADDSKIPDLKDPKVISAGRNVYLKKHCSHCHGANGDGGVNLTKRDLTDPSHVFQAIADGRERGSMRMPAARDMLSDEEIWQTTAYVMSIGLREK